MKPEDDPKYMFVPKGYFTFLCITALVGIVLGFVSLGVVAQIGESAAPYVWIPFVSLILGFSALLACMCTSNAWGDYDSWRR